MGELQDDSPGKMWEESPVCDGLKGLQGAALQPEIAAVCKLFFVFSCFLVFVYCVQIRLAD